MRDDSRIAAAIEVLETIHAQWAENSRAPADAILSDYFKQRRYMGSKDRAFVAEMIYFILRYGGALEWWLEQMRTNNSPRQIVVLALVLQYGYDVDDLKAIFTGEKHAPAPLRGTELRLAEGCHGQPVIHDAMPAWARYNVPSSLIPLLKQTFGDDFEEAIEALNQEAPLDLRMNTLKCPDRSDLIMALDKYHFYGAPTPHSPLGVRLKKREPVFTTQAFKDGWFEMQDEGSQIVAALVNAKPGDKVIDFCAGAGGKTLAIAAKMENKGRLLAWDVNDKRLNQIKKRLIRAGVDNTMLHVLDSETDPFIKRHHDTADWVLVDAPCSGSGTWRRNPDLKWRFTRQDLEELTQIQINILRTSAKLVKSSGRIVYATCSLFADENENQVKKFLVEHPDFRVEPLPEMWNKLRTWQEGVGSYLQLMPHRDGTDGFFAAIIRKL